MKIFLANFSGMLCMMWLHNLLITNIHNVSVQMKTPNSRNNTAFIAVVCENFIHVDHPLTPPPPLWTDMVF